MPVECFGFTSTKACQGRCKLISNQYADYGLQVCGLQEYGLSPVCPRRADCMITECNRGWCNLKLPRLEEGATTGSTRSVVSVAIPRFIYRCAWLLIWRLMERVGIENCFLLMLLWRKTAVAVQTALRMVLCAFLIRGILLTEVLAGWSWPPLALGIHCRNIWCCRVLSAAGFACLAANQRSQCVAAWCAIALLAPLSPP